LVFIVRNFVKSQDTLSHNTSIRAQFEPFAHPERIRGMIIGDDLDSLLSANYLQQRFGWEVVGVFCKYTWLWHVEDIAVLQRQVQDGQIIAIDLDVLHPTLPSVGHHIRALRGEPHDGAAVPHHLNPNTWHNLSVEMGFREKYPLSTLHLLWWLFEEGAMLPRLMRLMWLADSSFINAQHYQDNVTNWVTKRLQVPQFLEHLTTVQTPEFEQQLFEKTIQPLSENPLCQPNKLSKHRSKYLQLSGYQCQWSDPVVQNADLQDLCHRIAELSGWPVLKFPSHFNGMIEGVRHAVPTDMVAKSGMTLGQWLYHADVFSYAFVYRKMLNYTVLYIADQRHMPF
jgi:hypothetical protein